MKTLITILLSLGVFMMMAQTPPKSNLLENEDCGIVSAGTPVQYTYYVCPGEPFELIMEGATDNDPNIQGHWIKGTIDDPGIFWEELEDGSSTLLMEEGMTGYSAYFYYWVECLLTGESDVGSDIWVILATNTACYCSSTMTQGCEEDYISHISVTEDGSSLNSAPMTSDFAVGCEEGAYQELPSYGLMEIAYGDLVTFSLDINSEHNLSAKVWVDDDRDGVFSEEEVLTEITGVGESLSFEYNMSRSNRGGIFRIKIVRDIPASEIDPCADYEYGQTIDFNCYGYSVLDIEKNDFKNWKIYPNPAQDHIYIDGLTGEGQIMIYDLTGKQLLYNKWSQSEEKIDISSLESGMYIYRLSVSGENNYKTGKLVVK